MLKFRKILKESLIAKILIQLFIFNFFTGQCLAMMPLQVIADKLKDSNHKSFEHFSSESDFVRITLNKEDLTGKYKLETFKRNEFGQNIKKELWAKILREDGHDVLNFENFQFIIKDGMLQLQNGHFNYVGQFKTNLDTAISNFNFQKSFSIFARNIQIDKNLKSNDKLCLFGNRLLNDGAVFSPFLEVKIKNIKNTGSLTGANILVDSDFIECSKESVISSSRYTDITAKNHLHVSNSTIAGGNLKIKTNNIKISDSSGIQSRKDFTFLGSQFFIDDTSFFNAKNISRVMTNVFVNDGSEVVSSKEKFIVFSNIFINNGNIESKKTNIRTYINRSFFGNVLNSQELTEYDKNLNTFEQFLKERSDGFEGQLRRHSGIFSNTGSIHSNHVDILSEADFRNDGKIVANNKFLINSQGFFDNRGKIDQTVYSSSGVSKIYK